MVDEGFLDWGTEELSAGIRAGSLTSVDVVSACLRRIERRDPELHAFVKVFAEGALNRARALDAETTKGKWRGPLHGLPVAIKDLADIEGEVTGFGSRCYSGKPAERNARFVQALENAGAVIIGKTHTVEFAFGSWGTNYALGTPVNPSVPGHCVPGGSSSGSAVAVASGMVPLAIGSDTGGSVRIPAALCGVAGMKPSHGIIPLEGVAPLSASLDTIGPLAKDVAGLKSILAALREKTARTDLLASPVRYRTVSELDLQPVDSCTQNLYNGFIERLGALGHTVDAIALPLPLAEYQRRCGRIMAYDAYRALKKIIDDHRLPIDPWVRQRIAEGSDLSDADQEESLRQRTKDIVDFLDDFGPNDVLVLPTTPYPARPVSAVDENQMPMSRFTRLENYLDLSAVTIPLGRADTAPVGIQFVMRREHDDRLLAMLTEGNFAFEMA